MNFGKYTKKAKKYNIPFGIVMSILVGVIAYVAFLLVSPFIVEMESETSDLPEELTGKSQMTITAYKPDNMEKPQVMVNKKRVPSEICWRMKAGMSVYASDPGKNWIPSEILDEIQRPTITKERFKKLQTKHKDDPVTSEMNYTEDQVGQPLYTPEVSDDGTFVKIDCELVKE